jgi:hypothetical protein
VFDDHHKPCGLISLPSRSFLRCISSSTTILSRLFRTGEVFWKTPKGGPSGHLQRTVCDTRVTLGQEHCKSTSLHYGSSDGEASTIGDQARTIRPQAQTVRSLKNQKNPKETGSVKFIFSVLADRPRCTAGPSATGLSDI